MPDATRPPDVPDVHRPADLSSEIMATVQRQSDERVTCRRITGSHYRCNWWGPASSTNYDNPMMQGLMATTHRVRKSRFLNVTRTEQGLLIEEWPWPRRAQD